MEKKKKGNEHEINEEDAAMGDEIKKVDATKTVDDDDCNKWWQSTKQTLMNLAGGELEDLAPFSISIVPDELRKWNENAYKPKTLAMGPTYKGTGRDLLEMEAMKRACLSILLIRSEGTFADETIVTPEKGSLEEFSNMIWRNDESVRSCYTEEISLDRNKLATTMLSDCWFMLLLLISGSYESKKGLITDFEHEVLTPVRKMEEALTDLMLLENQIPLALVINLSQKLFPKQFRHDSMSTTINTFKDMALSLLGCSSPRHSNISSPVHFLQLVHSSIFLGRDDDDHHHHEEVKPKPKVNDQCLCLPMADNNEEERVDGGLNRCATRLHAAGVTLKPPDGQKRETTKKPSPTISSFNFDIRFRNGTLEIPQLHITEATEPLWRNFIAWEHDSKKWFGNYWRNASVELLTEIGIGDTFRCKCTWAALLFNGLICCSSDVQLLKDKRVIVDHLNMSNRDLVRFFRSITMGVDRGILVDYSSHNKMVAALNKYPASTKATEIATIGWHYLTKILEELLYSLTKFFRRRYNFAVTLGLVLGAVQALYSVLSYYQRK